jgi:sterol-4alpha-carboxylate 3-dehydrogenase (decarboxylating)
MQWKELGVSTPQFEITVIPVWFVMAMTGITEWVYWFATFGRKQPEPSRKALRYLKRGVSYDITKARERLGYQPVVGTDEGIRRSVKWAIDNGWKITG